MCNVCRGRGASWSIRGFTLVELLVVIGIIGVLISILLPALNRVRESSRITKCLSNIRQVNLALMQYLAENKNRLPDADYANGKTAGGGTLGPLSPANYGLPAYTPISHPSSRYVLPTIGAVLRPYLGKGDGAWKCPSGESSETGGRDEPYLAEINSSVAADEGDLFTGWNSSVRWRPNYFYMNTRSYLDPTGYASAGPTGDPTAGGGYQGWRGAEWTVRSIAGLNAAGLKSITGQKSAEIVTFVEYKSYFHSGGAIDIYSIWAPDKGKYKANYAYLDGHAETREYRNLDEYINNLHQPIPQTWVGTNWQQTFSGLYRPYRDRYPGAIPN